jgi:hypothetical protein
MSEKSAFQKYFPWMAIVFVGLVLIGQIIHIFMPVIFPDEIEFFQIAIAQAKACGHIWCPALNSYGYGSLWWNLFELVTQILTPDAPPALRWTFSSLNDPMLHAIYVMRLFSATALTGSVAFAAYSFRRQPFNAAAILGFLLLPLAWWNARWAGPDQFGMAFAIFGMVFMLHRHPKAALLFFGLSAALRLSNGLVLGGFMILAALDLDNRQLKDIRKYLLAALLVAAGIMIGNPDLLIHPKASLIRAGGMPIYRGSYPFSNYYYFILRMLTGNVLEWDLPTVGSLTFFWGGKVMFAGALVTGWLCGQRRIVIASLFGLLICIIAIVLRGVGYSWYLLPNIAATYIGIAATFDFSRIQRYKKYVVCYALTMGLVIAIYNSCMDYNFYVARAQTMYPTRNEISCGAKLMKTFTSSSDLWLNLDPTYTLMPIAQGTTKDDHILPMHETVDIITKENVLPKIGQDYYVTSDFMLAHSPLVKKIWGYMQPQSLQYDCGQFHFLTPR